MGSRAWITTESDGRSRIRIHQSALSDTDLCLERFRLGMLGEIPDGSSDAAAVGTGLHAAVEASIEYFMEYGEWLDLDTELEIAHETFNEEMAHPDARWVKRQRVGSETFLNKAVRLWDTKTKPTLRPRFTEVKFGPIVIHENEQVIIEIAGTIDYVDATGLIDWKTGSAHGWEAAHWEKQRWSVQSTMYTLGWAKHAEAHGLDVSLAPDGYHPFTFLVYLDNGTTKEVRTTRGQDDWDWLAYKILSLVPLLLSDLERWPTNDQHALCSPKWCPYWDACKGQFYPPTWPKHH